MSTLRVLVGKSPWRLLVSEQHRCTHKARSEQRNTRVRQRWYSRNETSTTRSELRQAQRLLRRVRLGFQSFDLIVSVSNGIARRR